MPLHFPIKGKGSKKKKKNSRLLPVGGGKGVLLAIKLFSNIVFSPISYEEFGRFSGNNLIQYIW